jgi:ribonuclease BN (tRNA processing enzyme)
MRLEVVGLRVGAPLEGACSCYAVFGSSELVLLDVGPGALERLWSRGLAQRLDAIVISHMHLDHMLDLLPMSGEVTQTELRAQAGYRPPALLLPRARGRAALAALAAAVGSRPARFDEAFDIREYDERDTIAVGALRLTFARTEHPEPCFAVRVTDGASSIVYGADGAASEALVRHAAESDVLMLEATYLDDGAGLELHGHMTGAQAGVVARRARARHLVLTHVGPWPQRNAENVRRARAHFAGKVELARSGAVYYAGTG